MVKVVEERWHVVAHIRFVTFRITRETRIILERLFHSDIVAWKKGCTGIVCFLMIDQQMLWNRQRVFSFVLEQSITAFGYVQILLRKKRVFSSVSNSVMKNYFLNGRRYILRLTNNKEVRGKCEDFTSRESNHFPKGFQELNQRQMII